MSDTATLTRIDQRIAATAHARATAIRTGSPLVADVMLKVIDRLLDTRNEQQRRA